MDARDAFESPTGIFFRDRIAEAGLTPRLGNPNWFYNREKVEKVRKGLEWDRTKSTPVFKLKLPGARAKVIDRAYISRLTGLAMNPAYSRDTMIAYSNADLYTSGSRAGPTQLTLDIAPYADANHHYVPLSGIIKTVALQENQLLVAKWYTANFLGLESRHLVNGRCAWFLKHLSDGDLLSSGWCPCQAICMALQHMEMRKTDGWNLPCLCSAIYNDVTGTTTSVSDDPVCGPQRAFIFFRSDIPGYWTGARVVGEHAPRYFGKDLELWRQWHSQHGLENLGGGFRYDLPKLELSDDAPAEVEMMEPGGDDGVNTQPRGRRRTAAGHRRTRVDRDAHATVPPPHAEGSQPFTPYVFTPPPGGPASLPDISSVARIPTAGYFYPEYIENVSSDPGIRALLHMNSMQLRLANNSHRLRQTGFRFTPSPTPSDRDEDESAGEEEESASAEDGSSSEDDA